MKTLSDIHPGEVLLEEFLVPMGISQNALARAAASKRLWLGLQTDYDLEEARRAIGRGLNNLDRMEVIEALCPQWLDREHRVDGVFPLRSNPAGRHAERH